MMSQMILEYVEHVLEAPKAHLIPAWGEAPCTGANNAPGLRARPIHISIPQIPLIELHSIFLKKCAELILKRLLAVMHILTIDVIGQRTQVSRPNREGSVTSLPRELRQVGRLGFEPFGRGRFELLHYLRDVRRARQANREMNVVRNPSYAKAFTFGVAGNGSKIRIERGTNRIVEDGEAVFCAEDNMNENKRKRSRHRVDYRSGLQPSRSETNLPWGFTPCWYKGEPSALPRPVEILLALFLLLPSVAFAQSQPLRIRVINAKTNQPVTNERLNVALKADQIGSVAMGTDKNGIILVNYGNATIIRILANMYADCRPRAELYINYPIDTILKTGIITGNLCGGATPRAHPGELVLFEVPKSYIPVFPAPPLPPPPHSDENPHQPPN